MDVLSTLELDNLITNSRKKKGKCIWEMFLKVRTLLSSDIFRLALSQDTTTTDPDISP